MAVHGIGERWVYLYNAESWVSVWTKSQHRESVAASTGELSVARYTEYRMSNRNAFAIPEFCRTILIHQQSISRSTTGTAHRTKDIEKILQGTELRDYFLYDARVPFKYTAVENGCQEEVDRSRFEGVRRERFCEWRVAQFLDHAGRNLAIAI